VDLANVATGYVVDKEVDNSAHVDFSRAGENQLFMYSSNLIVTVQIIAHKKEVIILFSSKLNDGNENSSTAMGDLAKKN
jgi:hypothetical protein